MRGSVVDDEVTTDHNEVRATSYPRCLLLPSSLVIISLPFRGSYACVTYYGAFAAVLFPFASMLPSHGAHAFDNCFVSVIESYLSSPPL